MYANEPKGLKLINKQTTKKKKKKNVSGLVYRGLGPNALPDALTARWGPGILAWQPIRLYHPVPYVSGLEYRGLGPNALPDALTAREDRVSVSRPSNWLIHYSV